MCILSVYVDIKQGVIVSSGQGVLLLVTVHHVLEFWHLELQFINFCLFFDNRDSLLVLSPQLFACFLNLLQSHGNRNAVETLIRKVKRRTLHPLCKHTSISTNCKSIPTLVLSGSSEPLARFSKDRFDSKQSPELDVDFVSFCKPQKYHCLVPCGSGKLDFCFCQHFNCWGTVGVHAP